MDLLTGKITIRQIFQDHWDAIYAKHAHDIPDYALNTVNKMLACRDPHKLGYAKYACPDHPDQFKIVPFSCKSRFCNSCGVLQNNKWIHKALSLLPDVQYYHVTFTVPDYLWYFLKERPHLLKFLFKASAETVLSWFKERHLIPAVCSGMHTFGKDLKYNSHIHMILSAGGLKYTPGRYSWQSINFFPFKNMLRERFKAILLKYLKPFLDPSLKELLYSLNWYVYVNLNVLDVAFTCQYIGRYAKKPALAQTRITAYDGHFVTFFYQQRGQPKTYCRLCAEQFILKLIQHILPPNFRVIRYYGLLANRVCSKFREIISQIFRYLKPTALFPPWAERQLKLHRRHPLLCGICGLEMILTELAFYSKSSDSLAFRFF
ncbi:MAG: transposase [Candidatus Omnitrophica bacterium]|nr:transposase [Candidatus Omnitrophota bacterium]